MFEVSTTNRGFEQILYGDFDEKLDTVVQAASLIGDYPDSAEKPGSSCLWLTSKFRIDREQAAELGERLLAWAKNGSLKLEGEP